MDVVEFFLLDEGTEVEVKRVRNDEWVRGTIVDEPCDEDGERTVELDNGVRMTFGHERTIESDIQKPDS